MFYELNLLDMKRSLPILKSPGGVYIAGFNPVGDMELIEKTGSYLSREIIKNNIIFDIILTTELKGIPIAQEVARNLKCDYICLRKTKKCYMLNPKHIVGGSITSGKSDYYISQLELDKLKNKKVLFVDDVFSSGETFDNVLEFSKNEQFKIVAGLSILKEGNENVLSFKYKDTPIYCCGFLPLPKIIE